MCSISGYSNLSLNKDLNAVFFKAMQHRGDDAERFIVNDNWVILHQRLSIIDTSDLANQPMENNKFSIALNGEIYNYIELKNEFLKNVKLKSASDTEVLLELITLYGLTVLNKLNGMFAFSLYDKGEKCMYLIRDRFGVKPLHWLCQSGSCYFSSEIRPLTKIIDKISINKNILRSYFIDTATDFNEETFVEKIYQVPAACYLKISADNRTELAQWYNHNDSKIDSSIFRNSKDTLECFEDLLASSINLRYRSDVPVCITLSGGLDSTAIYVIGKERLNSNLKAFCFQHKDSKSDESHIAKRLVKEYGDTPIIVENDDDEGIEDILNSLYYAEFPIWSPALIGYYLIYKKIKNFGFKVVIEGHGSDEQLGGYPYMIREAEKQHLSKMKLFKAYQASLVLKQTINQALDQGVYREKTQGFLKYCIYALLSRDLSKNLFTKKRCFDEAINDAFHYRILPIVLRTFDRMPMASTIESRAPFMDYRLVEFIKALPLEYKVSKLGSKAILREILKKYNKPYIYLNKAKNGFSIDIKKHANTELIKNFYKQKIEAFNLNEYGDFKKDALCALGKKELLWTDIPKIWKVASIQILQEMYQLK